MDRKEFARRRRQFMRIIGKDAIAILPAAPVRHRNGDIEYAYRQDSHFYYLSGFPEPDAVAVLVPGARGRPMWVQAGLPRNRLMFSTCRP